MVNWTEVCQQHSGLVFTIARRYLSACVHDPAIDLDDLMQTGYIGLMEAAQTHDESKGSFANWAAYYIRYEIRLMLSMHVFAKLKLSQMSTKSVAPQKS